MEKRQAKYDKKNTVQVKMKLNKKTDADVIGKLDSVGNKQGYIKALIREDLCKLHNDFGVDENVKKLEKI